MFRWFPVFLCCVLFCPLSAYAQTASLDSIGFLPGDDITYGVDITNDGVIAGASGVQQTNPAQIQGFRWDATNGFTPLGYFFGGSQSFADGISADGTVLVGYGNSAGHDQAFRWTSGGGLQGLGFLAGDNDSRANGVSADGSIVVGTSSGAGMEAFRWDAVNGMQGLGYLSSNTESEASAISADGRVIVGQSIRNGGLEAFRWDAGHGMQGLGHLPGGGGFSTATAANGDGTVVVGYSDSSNTGLEAFRWDTLHGMLGLGKLPGGNVSYALGVSRDGFYAVGSASDNNHADQAVVFINGTKIETLAHVLQQQGVDMTGWTLDQALAISPDGRLVTGTGYQDGVGYAGFIANIDGGGLITPEAIAQSLQSIGAVSSQVAQTGISGVAQSLFAARNLTQISTPVSRSNNADSFAMLSPAAGGAQTSPLSSSPLSLYTLGSVGIGQNSDFDNRGFNGTLGVSTLVAPDVTVGAGVIGSSSRTDLAFDGQSDVNAMGGSVIAAYTPFAGVRAYGAGFAADLDADITRGYQNGAGLAFSSGDADGFAYGFAGTLGYAFALDRHSTLMPYLDGRWAHTRLDGYTETGGPFPASFSSQSGHDLTSRLGVQYDALLNRRLDITLRGAWAHRYSDDAGSLTATSIGITQSIGGDRGDRNWAEASVGAGYRLTDVLYVNGELAARTGDAPEAQITATGGLTFKF